jgi:hypothetical protein
VRISLPGLWVGEVQSMTKSAKTCDFIALLLLKSTVYSDSSVPHLMIRVMLLYSQTNHSVVDLWWLLFCDPRSSVLVFFQPRQLHMLTFPIMNKRVLILRELLKQSIPRFVWVSLLLPSLALAQHSLLNLRRTNIAEVVISAREGTTWSYSTSSPWVLEKLVSKFRTIESSWNFWELERKANFSLQP